MRRTILGAALSLLPLTLPAQQEPDDYASAAAAYEQLAERLHKENHAYRVARADVEASEAYRRARGAGDRKEQLRMLQAIPRPDVLAMCREALDVAGRFEGDDAVRLLGWAAVQSRDKGLTQEVVGRIRQRHMESPALTELLERADVIARQLGREAGAAFLAEVVERSPHAVVQAWSLYWQSIALRRQDRATSEALRMRAAKLAEGHWLADKILGPEFKRERLQIGMVAPDIEGEDVDGVSFKLSDYRGKVVVLDFWGFW